MAKTIEFTGHHVWEPKRDSMSFEVVVDGKKTRCLISREALEDHYGADQLSKVEKSFVDNQSSIEDVARKIINKGQIANSGECLIRSQDV